MPIKKVIALMEKYGVCPDCGSDKLGNGSGTMYNDEHIFKRTCKCGLEVCVDEDDNSVNG